MINITKLIQTTTGSAPVYVSDRNVIAYYQQKASAEFWDTHWLAKNIDIEAIRNKKSDPYFIPRVQRYLPTGSVVLEGGCGHGQIVSALYNQGYRGIGVDVAEKTISHLKDKLPHLELMVGDVRSLEVKSDSLDGYISGGVIEHFWDGYMPILKEMQRTIKPGGYAFITFPFMSPLRKFKVALGAYPKATYAELSPFSDLFYQFTLDWQQVLQDFASIGFALVEFDSGNGIKGFKDEAEWFRPFLQMVYDGKDLLDKRKNLEEILKPIASHSALMVFRKIS